MLWIYTYLSKPASKLKPAKIHQAHSAKILKELCKRQLWQPHGTQYGWVRLAIQ